MVSQRPPDPVTNIASVDTPALPEGDPIGTVRYDEDNDLFCVLDENGQWASYLPVTREDDVYGGGDPRDVTESTIVVGSII